MGKTINFKRTLAVCLAFLLFGLSCIFQTNNNNANAANTSVSYQVFHSQTGFYLRSYTLNPLNSSNNTRTIIGTDDRVIDWSKSGVVKLMTTNGYIGTGFVVDEHTIATAAHCVYDVDNNTGRKISNILLFNSEGEVEMSVIPQESHVPSEYVGGDLDVDYALITVEEDLSDYMCFDLGVALSQTFPSDTTINVTGFPGMINDTLIVNTHTIHNMYTGSGTLVMFSGRNILYNTDATGGNSGGPAYVTETRCGKTYNTVIAINVAAGPNENWGKLIDTNILHFLTNNGNISY